jgi:hypothetical protein
VTAPSVVRGGRCATADGCTLDPACEFYRLCATADLDDCPPSGGDPWREHAEADHAALSRVAALADQLEAGDHDAEFSEGWPWHITDRAAAMIREAITGGPA